MNINAKDARWPRCSAENFGRFIPCRGGGTATTYYTDDHNVDEDRVTISRQGGDWGIWWCYPLSGVFLRDMTEAPTDSPDVVALYV